MVINWTPGVTWSPWPGPGVYWNLGVVQSSGFPPALMSLSITHTRFMVHWDMHSCLQISIKFTPGEDSVIILSFINYLCTIFSKPKIVSKKNFQSYLQLKSNLCKTTTLGAPENWSLFKRGLVFRGSSYKISNIFCWLGFRLVVFYRSSLFREGWLYRFDCNSFFIIS
jgi:hypothetical protein